MYAHRHLAPTKTSKTALHTFTQRSDWWWRLIFFFFFFCSLRWHATCRLASNEACEQILLLSSTANYSRHPEHSFFFFFFFFSKFSSVEGCEQTWQRCASTVFCHTLTSFSLCRFFFLLFFFLLLQQRTLGNKEVTLPYCWRWHVICFGVGLKQISDANLSYGEFV